MKVSISSYKQWQKCRRAWFFQYRLGLEPKTPSTALFLGSGVHEALGMYYRKNCTGLLDEYFRDWAAEAIHNMRTELAFFWQIYESDMLEQVELGAAMLRHYQQYYAPQTGRDDFEIIDSEINFEFPICDDVSFRGRVDGLIRSDNGLLWVFEHKTAKNLNRIDWTSYDPQCTGYIWAAQELSSSPVQGMLYNFMLKDVPKAPKMLKSGKYSTDKRLKTTYEVFRQTLLEHGRDPSAYSERLTELRLQGNPFFARIWETRTHNQLNRWRRYMQDTVADMLHGKICPTFGYDCSWCSFSTPCHALELDADIDLALDGYQKRHRDDEEATAYLPASEIDWSQV